MSINRTKDAALKELAWRLVTLSFRDMQKFADIFDAKNGDTRDTAKRLLAVADEILGPDYNPRASAIRGGDL